MNFIDTIKICYTSKYKKFDGRSSKSEFWYFILFYYGIIALAVLIDIYFINIPLNEFSAETESLSGGVVNFIFIFAIVSTLPYVGVAIRRWNDAKKSGSIAPESLLLGFIPVGMGLMGVVLFVFKIQDYFLI